MNKTFNIVNNDDGNVSFPIEANNVEDAAILALQELGYSISVVNNEDNED